MYRSSLLVVVLCPKIYVYELGQPRHWPAKALLEVLIGYAPLNKAYFDVFYDAIYVPTNV